MIDAAVALETQTEKRDLSVAWVDYRKAFDVVPHELINLALKAVRAHRQVRRQVWRMVRITLPPTGKVRQKV